VKRDTKNKSIFSPCDVCLEFESFSFQGCMETCQEFLEHLKEVAKKKESPCADFRCGVPGVDSRHRERCEKCPIRDAYARSVGGNFGPKDKTKCVLGIKDPNVYLSTWELNNRYRLME